MIFSNKKGSIQKFFSVFITISIVALLVFVTPANAFDLELSEPSNPNPIAGELVSFTATVNIDTNEQVPLEELEITVKNQVCKFKIDGTPISGCEDITIQLLELDANYQIGNNTFEYKDDEYDYGYGYGYGKNTNAKIKYNITINTTDYNPGTYKLQLKTQIDSDKFKSEKSEFKVKKSKTTIRINAGGNEYTDSNGNVWAKDNSYNTGYSSKINTQYQTRLMITYIRQRDGTLQVLLNYLMT